jgi:hypothetical protein
LTLLWQAKIVCLLTFTAQCLVTATQACVQTVQLDNTALATAAQHNGFHVVNVKSDGNCAYHAIVDQLKIVGIESDVGQLRQQAVNYLMTHREKVDSNFFIKSQYSTCEEYLGKHSMDKCWADELMLRAVGACLQTNIRILHNSGNWTELLYSDWLDSMALDGDGSLQCSNEIIIGLIGEQHYVSLHKQETHNTTSPNHDAENASGSQSLVSETDDVDPLEKPNELTESHNTDCQQFPSVWNHEQWLKWSKNYTWLCCEGGKLGCSVCMKANVHVEASKGVHLSDQWQQVSVDAKSGRKLKEKIYKHRDSAAHMTAVHREEQKCDAKLEKLFADSHSKQFEETVRVFRTAYLIAKENLSLVKHGSLLQLQELNGLSVGGILRSYHSCANIVRHIADSMKKKFCTRLEQTDRKISVMLDEATVHGKSVLVIYLRTCLGEIDSSKVDGIENVFLVLSELTKGTLAENITQTVEQEMTCLPEKWLKNSLVGICTDGAAVMTGRNTGVATMLSRKFGPQVESFHCMAHRLELSVAHSLKAITAINHFQIFISSMYTLYR